MEFTKQLNWLNGTTFVIGFLIFMGLDNSKIDYMRHFAGVLFGLIILFLVTTVLKDVLSRINKFSNDIQEEFKNRINSSIDKEIKTEDYNKKIEICTERERLYEQAKSLSSDALYKSIKNGVIFLIICIGICFMPNFTIPNTEILSLHLIFFSLIIGFYYTMKVVLIFLELIRLGTNK